MAHIHKKIKNGKNCYYVRETAWVDGKSKVINQFYLGSADKIFAMVTAQKTADIEREQVLAFGALWLANQIEERVGLVKIIDEILPRRTKGPSMGEYFLYAVFNRMIDSKSKHGLPDWYAKSAVQFIRPVTLNALDSDGYYQKWSTVTEEDLQKIAKVFFQKVASLHEPGDGCFLFDTTNYYTFIASRTKSELAKRGKNKEGRNWLRQIGLALLVDRVTRLPFHYRAYQGNRHDSKVFNLLIEELTGAMRGSGKQDLTLVVDKGMNSPENYEVIDEKSDVHFITTYSPYLAAKLVLTSRDHFKQLDIAHNRTLQEQGDEEDCIRAWRTEGEYWGRDRTVVVTYNPRSAAKQRHTFDDNLQNIKLSLFEMRRKIKEGDPHWKNETDVRGRYIKLCGDTHMPNDLFDLNFVHKNGSMTMQFEKNFYKIDKYIEKLGKNILITDRNEWSTEEIVSAAIDRYKVEEAFRQSKNDDLVSVSPIRHWTDTTIHCHIFSCVIALTYLRLLEYILAKADYKMTADCCMKIMRPLNSILHWSSKQAMKPYRTIENPTPAQAAILQVFGYQVVKGVLGNS